MGLELFFVGTGRNGVISIPV